MLQGIPFQKSSVMLEMLAAINTVCIFMTKNWEMQNFKTHSKVWLWMLVWDQVGDLNLEKPTLLVLVHLMRPETGVLLRHSKAWN